MIDCANCDKPIGSLDEPIFVDREEEQALCRECCTEKDREPPAESRAEFDPDDVSEADLRDPLYNG